MNTLKSLLLMTITLSASALADPVALKSGLDLSGFDRSVRPQDDLYRFAGGTWLAKTPIPSYLSNYGTFSVLDETAQAQLKELLEQAEHSPPPPGSAPRKAADFYHSFMDTQRIEAAGLKPLAGELQRIEAIKTREDIVRYLGYSARLAVALPLNWDAPQDAGDSAHYITTISQSGLSMPDRDYYLSDEPSFREYRTKLHEYIAQLLQLAGAAPGAAQAQAEQILAFETALAHAQWTQVDNRDPLKTYNKFTLASAHELAPAIDWKAYFEAVGAPTERLVINQPSYVSAVSQMIATQPIEQWRTYLRYHLLDAYAPFLPRAYDDLAFGFHQHTLSGVQQQKDRWKRALGTVDAMMGEATGQMYVARYFPPESKQRVHVLVDNLLRAYGAAIDQLEWMGPATRVQAKTKLGKIALKLGYPDKWRDYSALQIVPDDLIGNVRRATEFELHRIAQRRNGPVDRGEWGMTPQTINAYYNPAMNEIVFPAAILQPPFFDPTADDAVNYGGIGAVIGHEISHGFDDQGRKFDADGNLRDWWTPSDAAQFKQRTTALAAQYGAYTVLDGVHVNGELTLGENIADVSGLAIAYKAYELSLAGKTAPQIDGFSGPQRFFLGWAQVWRRNYRDDNLRMRIKIDPHSPSQFRADGAPRNNDAFYQAFGVGPGDQLYLPADKRVKIW